ncbi:MAG TPA: glycosyltransferase family 4 protein [Thermoplasmata archaeon]|nr:glycosyltransferase family 4 protein [Thermoplasmata archaeon]
MTDRTPSPRDETVVGIRACMVAYSHYPDDPRVSREARTLDRAGVDVDVICLRGAGQPIRENIEGVEVYRIPLATRRGSRRRYAWQYGTFFLLAAVALSRAWRRRRYDIIHVHSLPDFLVFASALPRAFGARIILDLHEAMPEILAARFGLENDASLVRVARALERASAAFADEIFVVNDTIRDLLVSRGIPPHKLAVLPNTPDEESMPPSSRQVLVDRYGLQGEHAIVVAGGLNPERDIETLIRSIALPPLAGSVDLLLLGRGDPKYLAGLRALAEGLGLRKRVVFGGFVPHAEAMSLLSLSEVGVVTLVENPITRLGLPNRLFEYAMLGKPLVVPRLPAITDFVGPAGFYYSPGNPTDLAAAITEALSPQAVAKAEAVPERYEQVRWSRVAGRLLEAYAAHDRSRRAEALTTEETAPCT